METKLIHDKVIYFTGMDSQDIIQDLDQEINDHCDKQFGKC
jgi:hypothetical protein